MKTKKLCSLVSFPAIAATLGGAEYARTVADVVEIKLPGRDLVRVPLRELPPSYTWTAFNLADAVAWRDLVAENEAAGMTRSDAQGCADAHFMIRGKVGEAPTIAMCDFFALPEVKAMQSVQERNRYGSPAHRVASEKLRELARTFNAESFFGDY